MKKINISTPKYPNTFTLVDNNNYEYLNKYHWYKTSNGYVMTDIWKNNKCKKLTMHRMIMEFPESFIIDHVNHNKLDNRICNLRLCTRGQNIMNSRKRKNCLSKYKGVTLDKRKRLKKWYAQIVKEGNYFHSQYFLTEKEAAKAYNCMARILFGEFAYENIT